MSSVSGDAEDLCTAYDWIADSTVMGRTPLMAGPKIGTTEARRAIGVDVCGARWDVDCADLVLPHLVAGVWQRRSA